MNELLADTLKESAFSVRSQLPHLQNADPYAAVFGKWGGDQVGCQMEVIMLFIVL